MNVNENENILEILHYPNAVLLKKSDPVDKFDDELAKLIKSLFATMYASNGVGLAAPQVGILKKLAVIEYEDNKIVLINPKVIEKKGLQDDEEGCLSFPGIYAHVNRPQWVKIETLDEQGNKKFIEAEGYTARAVLHEMDHLEGKLFIDYLSNLKKNAIRKKVSKHTGGHF